MNFGCDREWNVSLCPFEQVGMASGGDEDIRQCVGGGDKVVHGFPIGMFGQRKLEDAGCVAPLGDRDQHHPVQARPDLIDGLSEQDALIDRIAQRDGLSSFVVAVAPGRLRTFATPARSRLS